MYYQEMLFDLPVRKSQPDEQTKGTARLRKPQRMQTDFTLSSIDDLIPTDHIARTIWDIVCALDLSDFLNEVQAIEGRSGRPATDPRILLGLWILATLEGIGSARTLEQYSREHRAFIWMCGNVSMNYHTLSDFRTQGVKIEAVLKQIVGSLIHQGVISTESWAQDGMRVRASAGSGSFRRQKTLSDSIQIADQRVRQLKKNAHSDAERLSCRKKAAKERAASERAERCKEALKTIKQLEKDIDKRRLSKKDKQKTKKNARVSTTDPEARKMKMPNGGYNPAYNVQYITDTKSRIITGVLTVNKGSDKSLMIPMINKIFDDYHIVPNNLLLDGGYVSEDGLKEAEKFGIELLMPPTDKNRKRYAPGLPLPASSNAISRWIERMETEEAKNIYRSRASSAEFSNASTRNKGFYQFKVRGCLKAHATSVLFALTHNIERIISMIRSGCKISLNFA